MRDLIKHSLVYTLASVASRGAFVVALIVLPFLLTPTQYGMLGLIAAVAAIVTIVVPLEISQGLARYYATAAPAEKGALAGTAWWFSLLALAGVALAAMVAAEPLAAALFGVPGQADILRIAVPFFIANTLILFLQSQCRWDFRVADFVWISVGYAVLTIGLSLGLAASAGDALAGALIGQAAGGGLMVAAGAWRLRRTIFHMPVRTELRRMLAFSLPLVPANIALVAAVYAGRVILSDRASLADVGLFTFATQIATMPSLTILGIQAALTPLIMARHEEPDTPATIARLFHGFVAVAGMTCAAFGLFAEPAIRLVGAPTYAGAGELVMILAPGLLAMQIYIFAPGFAIARRTALQMLVTLATMSLGVVASYLLTARFGAVGAAWAVLGSGLGFAAAWFVLSQRLYPVPFRWDRLAGFGAAFVTVGVAQWVLPRLEPAVDLLVRGGLLTALGVTVPVLGLLTVEDARTMVASVRRKFASSDPQTQ